MPLTAAAKAPSLPCKPGIRTELLRSEANPDGCALDELLAQIRTEFQRQLLGLDGREAKVRDRLAGYERVISALWEAEGRYRALGPHQNGA